MVAPDPKPARRIRATAEDWQALRAAKLIGKPCRVCERQAESLHHLLPRSQGGDDVAVNLIPLCGSGTTGCHGAIEAAEWLPRSVLGSRLSPEEVEYVRRKLGREAGDDFLKRRYSAVLT